jgi:hypothetical protein
VLIGDQDSGTRGNLGREQEEGGVLMHARWPRWVVAAVLIAAFGSLLALPARAVELRSGDVVAIAGDEVIDDDLFLSGNRVVVDGTVNGDLWVAGSQVEVNGAVNGSLFFAGQNLSLNGDVAGSLYAAGSSVTLGSQARVGRNAFFAGYALRTAPGSAVGRDLSVAGTQALHTGQVGRHLNFGGNALEIGGAVGGNVEASVAAPDAAPLMPGIRAPGAPRPAPPGIRVSEDATIAGQLTYQSPADQSENIRAQPGGGVVFRRAAPALEVTPDPAVAWLLGWIRLFVTLLALGALAIWGLGAPVGALADRVYVVPLLSLGWGILITLAGLAAAFVAALLIVIVGSLLALLTLGGLVFTVLGAAGAGWAFGLAIFLLALLYGSRIVISYLLGVLVLERLGQRTDVQPVWLLLVGALIYSLLQSIPFVGGAINLAAVLIGFGAIYLAWRDSLAPRA